jgi:hypothetical protein
MSWLRSQFRTFHRIHRWWKNRLTVTGRSLALVTLTCSPAVIIPDSALTIFFASSFFLLLLSWLVARLHSPKLTWNLVQNRAWRCLEPRVLELHVENRGRLPALDLHLGHSSLNDVWSVEILEPHIGRLLAGETTSVRIQLTPLLRGEHPLPRLSVESQFPLGIHRIRGSQPQPENTLVYPAAAQPMHPSLWEAGQSRATGQQQFAGHSGWSGDYVGSREYFPGMSVRRWDYGSWARLGRPVVREFSNPQCPQARLLLDLRRLSERDDEIDDSAESVIAVAGELGKSLVAMGFQISCIQNLGEHPDARSSKDDWNTDEIEQFLARLPVPANSPPLQTSLGNVNPSDAWTVILTCPSDSTGGTLLEDLTKVRLNLSLCLIQPGHWPRRDRLSERYQAPAILDILHQTGAFQ